MKTLKELLEERGQVAARSAELSKDADTFTPEQQTEWNTLQERWVELTKAIQAAEAAEAIRQKAKAMADEQDAMLKAQSEAARRATQHAGAVEISQSREERDAIAADSLQGWMRAQVGLPLTERHREAMERCGVREQQRDYNCRLVRGNDYETLRRVAYRGMSTTDAVGGYTIPTGFVQNFELALLAFSGPRQVAQIIRTDSGNDLPWPTGNDTSNTGELLGEETSVGSTVNPTIGLKTFYAYKMSSKLIQISPELLQDSAFDMASQLGRWLGERIGRVENTYYTTGTGSAQPQGVVTGATAGPTTASATAITLNEVLDLIHGTEPSYRTNAVLMMNDAVVLYLRKLAGGIGQYLWQDSAQVGVPPRLHGYPIYINSAMASTVQASAKTILFGDFSKFIIRDVAEVRMRRLVERYADTDQEGFIAFHRTDSGLIDAGTHPIEYLLQHA